MTAMNTSCTAWCTVDHGDLDLDCWGEPYIVTLTDDPAPYLVEDSLAVTLLQRTEESTVVVLVADDLPRYRPRGRFTASEDNPDLELSLEAAGALAAALPDWPPMDLPDPPARLAHRLPDDLVGTGAWLVDHLTASGAAELRDVLRELLALALA